MTQLGLLGSLVAANAYKFSGTYSHSAEDIASFFTVSIRLQEIFLTNLPIYVG